MPKPINKLDPKTVSAAVKRAKQNGVGDTLADGGGLMLEIRPDGAAYGSGSCAVSQIELGGFHTAIVAQVMVDPEDRYRATAKFERRGKAHDAPGQNKDKGK